MKINQENKQYFPKKAPIGVSIEFYTIPASTYYISYLVYVSP